MLNIHWVSLVVVAVLPVMIFKALSQDRDYSGVVEALQQHWLERLDRMLSRVLATVVRILRNQGIITRNQMILRRDVRRVEALVRKLLPGSGFVGIHVLEERSDGMKFELTLGAADPDVAKPKGKRRITNLTIAGAAQADIELPGTATATVDPLFGAQDDMVEGVLTDYDDAGNPSQPRPFSGQLLDTIPPGQPGEVFITVLSEEDAPVDPAPPVDGGEGGDDGGAGGDVQDEPVPDGGDAPVDGGDTPVDGGGTEE